MPDAGTFEGGLVLREVNVGEWELAHDLLYIDDDGEEWLIPQGQRTDMASTPRGLWPWFPPFGTYSKAAVVHDCLYRSHRATRREADAIFYRAMIACGTARWRARVMWWGVRCFGFWAYRAGGKS